MAVNINYKTNNLGMSNRAFGILVEYGIEVAKQGATPEELQFIDTMRHRHAQLFYLDIAKDMPSVAEQKFWSRVFFDTARAIFERNVGSHEHSYWQAQAIYIAYSAAKFFQAVVQDGERGWEPTTIDTRDFDRIVNKIER